MSDRAEAERVARKLAEKIWKYQNGRFDSIEKETMVTSKWISKSFLKRQPSVEDIEAVIRDTDCECVCSEEIATAIHNLLSGGWK